MRARPGDRVTPSRASRMAGSASTRSGRVPERSAIAFLLAVVHVSVVRSETIAFTRHDVVSQNPGLLSEGFTVGDLDGDGRPDMVEGGESALRWYHNPDWTSAAIATGFRYAAGAAI